MKKHFHLILLLMTFGLITWQLTACKRTPTPPTEQDAIAVWRNTHAKPHLNDLIDFKKTNGQIEEVNGVKVYTLYYEVKEKSVVQLAMRLQGLSLHIKGTIHFSGQRRAGWDRISKCIRNIEHTG